MGFSNPNSPNLTDFQSWLNETVAIPTNALPAGSPWPGYALNGATALVLNPPCSPGILYTLAVYNCATHLLFTIAPDPNGVTFFTNARSAKGFGIVQPTTGLVVSSSDESTSATLAEPDWASKMTPNQLAFFKTPWGREYLSWQQSYGPTIVGLT